jgi:hypothetical protein
MPGNRLRQTGTIIATHLHHRMPRHPRPSQDLFPRRWRGPPEGRRILGCTGVGDVYRSGRTDQDHVASAAMAGSMPAWAPLHSGAPTRALRCSPDRVGVAGRSGEGVTVPQGAPEAPLRRRHCVSGRMVLRCRSERFPAARDPLQSCSRYSAGLMWNQPGCPSNSDGVGDPWQG